MVMPKPITRPDLLERYEKLGFSNRFKFEQKHGLPMNLMGKMKLGGYASAASLATLSRLEAAIKSEEDAMARGLDAPPLPGDAIVGPAGGRPTKQESLTQDDVSAVEEFIEALEGSTTIGEVDACNKKLSILIVKGIVTDATGRVLKELLAERRQSLKAQADEEEKARSGKELLIRVVFVRGWTGGPLPTEAPSSAPTAGVAVSPLASTP